MRLLVKVIILSALLYKASLRGVHAQSLRGNTEEDLNGRGLDQSLQGSAITCSEFEGPHLTCRNTGEDLVNVNFERKGACAATSSMWRDCNTEDNRDSCLQACSELGIGEGCCSYRAHLASGNNGIDSSTGKYGCLFYPGSEELDPNGNADIYGSICSAPRPSDISVPTEGGNEPSCTSEPDDIVGVFTETATELEVFSDVLEQYAEGSNTNGGRALLFPLLISAASALGGLMVKAAPAIGFGLSAAGFGLSLSGELDDTDEKILAELGKINSKLDAIDEKLEEGFTHVVNEIKLNDANMELDSIFHILTGTELDFKHFTAQDLSDNAREEYKIQFRESCNVPNWSPADIFRYLYGHACTDCNAIDGGSRQGSYFLNTFKAAANKKDLGDAIRFRRGFGLIMMSALSRALFLHSVCLPITEDLDRCEDPIWSSQLEQMAAAIEEVAETLIQTEADLRDKWVMLRTGINSKFCLDGDQVKTGHNVHLWTCHGGTNQLWKIDENGFIHSKRNNGKCLDPEGPSTRNLSPLQTWDCINDYMPQKWFLDSQGRIQSQWTPGKCIDVKKSQATKGQPIIMFDCHDGKNQVWA